MSQKRKAGDVADGGRDVPHTKKQRSFEPRRGNVRGQNKPGLARGKKPSHGDDETKTDSTSALKGRIRNLTRLLEHLDKDAKNKVPANVRNERERELEACRHELAEKLAADRETDFRNKIIGKYHHIRFFERQKATRTVKRLTKQLSTTEDNSERAALRSKLHNSDVDVNYTIYYPLLKPYVSLFPKPKEDKSIATGDKQNVEFADGPKGDLEMWKAVEEAMEAGTLDRLRNSREGVVMPGPITRTQNDTKGRERQMDRKLVQKLEPRKLEAQEEDDGSDGGFFDE